MEKLPKTARPPRLSSRCRAGLELKSVKIILFSALQYRRNNSIQIFLCHCCARCPPRLPCEIHANEKRSVFHRGSFGKWYWG